LHFGGIQTTGKGRRTGYKNRPVLTNRFTAACVIKQEAEEVPTLHSLISVLVGIEEEANNMQLSNLLNVMF